MDERSWPGDGQVFPVEKPQQGAGGCEYAPTASPPHFLSARKIYIRSCGGPDSGTITRRIKENKTGEERNSGEEKTKLCMY